MNASDSRRTLLLPIAALACLLLFLPKDVLALTVESPNGGEHLRSGMAWEVQLADAAGVAQLAVYFSLDGGVRWSRASGSRKGTTFRWRVPEVTGNKNSCMIEVLGYGATGRLVSRDRSDLPFSIVLLELLTPVGMETFTPGEIRPIRWELNQPPLRDGYLSVEYTSDGGASWSPLR